MQATDVRAAWASLPKRKQKHETEIKKESDRSGFWVQSTVVQFVD